MPAKPEQKTRRDDSDERQTRSKGVREAVDQRAAKARRVKKLRDHDRYFAATFGAMFPRRSRERIGMEAATKRQWFTARIKSRVVHVMQPPARRPPDAGEASMWRDRRPRAKASKTTPRRRRRRPTCAARSPANQPADDAARSRQRRRHTESPAASAPSSPSKAGAARHQNVSSAATAARAWSGADTPSSFPAPGPKVAAMRIVMRIPKREADAHDDVDDGGGDRHRHEFGEFARSSKHPTPQRRQCNEERVDAASAVNTIPAN